MLGPLPVLYRVVVFVSALVCWVALGVWLALATPVPTPTDSGLLLGAGLGLLSAVALVHQHRRHAS